MKSYLEIADRVFERGEEIREESRKRKKRIITLASSLMVCFVIGIAIWTVIDKGLVYKNEPISIDKEKDFTEYFSTENESADDKNSADTSIAEESVKQGDNLSPANKEDSEEPTNNSFFSSDGSQNGTSASESMETGEGTEGNYSKDYSESNSSFSPDENDISEYDEMRSIYSNASDAENDEKIYVVIIELYYDSKIVDDETILESEKKHLIEKGIHADVINDGDTKVLSAKMTLSEMKRFNDENSGDENEYSYVTRIVE